MAVFSHSSVIPHGLQSWNKLIKKQVLEGKPERAILTYIQMQEIDQFADNFTYPILLKAVAAVSLHRVGLSLHGQIIKTGFCNHSFVQTALLNFYSHFGCSVDAWRVFEHVYEKDVVAWNSMLDAYASGGEMDYAMALFDSMTCKDLLSYNTMVSGYARSGNMALAEFVFDKIPKRDVISWNSMILACCNAGDMNRARNVFDRMKEKNVITWNTMLSGYLGCERFDCAIALFEEMRMKNYDPDYLSIASVLSACANLGSLVKGKEVHILALKKGLTSSPHVATSLIDMYAKCGRIESSLEVFYKSQIKDIYSWNAMISGLALHGHACDAIKLFDDMKIMDFRPDDITFIGLLSACSHAGFVETGIELFHSMEMEYRINPKLEHYGCIVDILGRAGFLHDAFQVVKSMPFEPGETVLGALLGACVSYRDLETGEKVMELLERRCGNLSDGEYMMVANLYSCSNQWEEANRWIKMMNDRGISKTAGCSISEVNGEMHKFVAGDKSNFLEQSVLI